MQLQQPSPALSSPSTGFLGPRVSPLFNSCYDASNDGVGALFSPSDPLRSPPEVGRFSQDQEHEQEAPPKKLSRAMEGLGKALRHIADVRSGGDLLLEALEPKRNEFGGVKNSEGVLAATEVVKKALDALRAVGRDLESSGILRGAQQRYEDNQPWGLQPPTVCPDGQVAPYALKRQIAGQAAASAFDRTRLALKSFGEQKKRLFSRVGENSDIWKRNRIAKGDVEDSSLGDVLRQIHVDAPGMAVTPYVRMEWGKRILSVNLSKVSSDPSQVLASLPTDALNPLKLEPEASSQPTGPVMPEAKVSVLEVTICGALRAVVSLLPAGSTCPDSIAVFSPDEEQALNALHFFSRLYQRAALVHLLHWLHSYRTLFTQPCNECKRMTCLDAPSDLLLPPFIRLYHRPPMKSLQSSRPEDAKLESGCPAFHIGCVRKS